ncbi:MAG: glycosyltransferase family 39 protein [Actinobacteria bacterium]|nr:glycosyltransferase family 39 protein [Actinomycetota bacterium]
MVYIYFVLSILSLFFIGYLPAYFLLPGKSGFRVGSRTISGGFFIFFISFYLGSLMAAWLFIVLSLMDIKYSGQLLISISSVFFIFYVYNFMSRKFRNREKKKINRLDRDIQTARESRRVREIAGKDQEGHIPPGYHMPSFTENGRQPDDGTGAERIKFERDNRKTRILFVVLTVFVVANFLLIVFFTVLFPIKFWDAIACWSLKGKAFFIDGIINNFFTEHSYTFSHFSYPLYLPLIQTWILSWMGQSNENILKLIFPLFYSSLIFTLYYLFRQRARKLLSVFLVFIVSVLPVIVDHGYIEYTNLLFSVVLLLAVYFFYIAWTMKGKTSFLILSALFFSILAMTRSEGILYVLLFIIINLFFFISESIRNKPDAKNIMNFLLPLIVFILFLGPWYLLKLKLGLPFLSTEWHGFINSSYGYINISGIREAARAISSQMLLSIYDSTRAVFSSFYGPVWFMLLIAMLFSLKTHFNKFSWIFFVFLSFGFISIFVSIASVSDFASSTERYVLHLFPTAYYWIMSNSIGRSLDTVL